MQIHEGVCAEVGTKASGVLELDFEFPDSALGGIVVWRYCRIPQEVEYVVAAFEQTVLECSELFIQFGQILVDESVKSFEPWRGINLRFP